MTDLARPKSYRLTTLKPRNCIETLNNSNSLNFCQKKAKIGHLIRAHRDLSIITNKIIIWYIYDDVWLMIVSVKVGLRSWPQRIRSQLQLCGILFFHYHLNRSDKWININKINSISSYTASFINIHVLSYDLHRSYGNPNDSAAERYRHSRPAYANPLFLKSLSICRIESLFLLTPGTLLYYNPIPKFSFESIHFPRR